MFVQISEAATDLSKAMKSFQAYADINFSKIWDFPVSRIIKIIDYWSTLLYKSNPERDTNYLSG